MNREGSCSRFYRFFLVILFFSCSFTVFAGENTNSSATAKIEAKVDTVAQKIDALASQSLALRGGSNNNQDFSGISWGIGVGSSYLGKENITNAVVVGSQTRILEKNRRSAGVILETHYLLPVHRNKGKVLSEATEGTIRALKNLLDTAATDTSKIKNCIEELSTQITGRVYLTRLASGSITELYEKLMKQDQTKYPEAIKTLTEKLKRLRFEPKSRGASCGVGPFCCIKMGGSTLIDGFGIGLMIGIKSEDDARVLNIGVAKGFQANVKRISASFDPIKEADPAKMFTNQDVDAWTLVISTKIW